MAIIKRFLSKVIKNGIFYIKTRLVALYAKPKYRKTKVFYIIFSLMGLVLIYMLCSYIYLTYKIYDVLFFNTEELKKIKQIIKIMIQEDEFLYNMLEGLMSLFLLCNIYFYSNVNDNQCNINNIFLSAKGEHKESTLDNSTDKSASSVIGTENSASGSTDINLEEKDKKQQTEHEASSLASKETQLPENKQSEANVPTRLEEETNISTEKTEMSLKKKGKQKAEFVTNPEEPWINQFIRESLEQNTDDDLKKEHHTDDDLKKEQIKYDLEYAKLLQEQENKSFSYYKDKNQHSPTQEENEISLSDTYSDSDSEIVETNTVNSEDSEGTVQKKLRLQQLDLQLQQEKRDRDLAEILQSEEDSKQQDQQEKRDRELAENLQYEQDEQEEIERSRKRRKSE